MEQAAVEREAAAVETVMLAVRMAAAVAVTEQVPADSEAASVETAKRAAAR